MTETEMKQRLEAHYPSSAVEIHDMTGNGSNFQVKIISDAFKDMNRVQRHQSVMGVFAEELKSGAVHAMTIRALTQGESDV